MKTIINDTWEIEVPEFRANFHNQRVNWERERTESLFKHVKKDDVIIDVGTEVGDYAALFTSWGTKVFCIEPQPKYWPIIRETFELNKLDPIGCFAGFASNVNEANPTLADFEIGNKGLWPNCAFDEIEDWNGFRNVLETGISTPQMRIDQIVQEYGLSRVDVINIDVEGAEFEVLKGAVTTLNVQKPLVYLSFHPEMIMRDWSNNFDDLCAFMKPLGYDWAFIAKDHEEHWLFWNPDRKPAK